MELKNGYRVTFRGKKGDNGELYIVVSANSSEEALEKAISYFNENREELKHLTNDFFILPEDLNGIMKNCDNLFVARALYSCYRPVAEGIGYVI